ncbi:hypothetical protein [Nocardia farcinica]|uniref:hypothetical protein n=1 Tax=Nocardia farcinica TaxID=37329 RepID=UPI00245896A6|nr:hypothetical protein [Nocardia farcinica]
MTTEPMTPDQEYEYYAREENQQPQGKGRRRRPRLSEPLPVRFPRHLLEQIRQAAAADNRSVSAWLRLAAEERIASGGAGVSVESVEISNADEASIGDATDGIAATASTTHDPGESSVTVDQNVSLPKAVLHRARGLARERGVSVEVWLREAIEQAVTGRNRNDVIPVAALRHLIEQYLGREPGGQEPDATRRREGPAGGQVTPSLGYWASPFLLPTSLFSKEMVDQLSQVKLLMSRERIPVPDLVLDPSGVDLDIEIEDSDVAEEEGTPSREHRRAAPERTVRRMRIPVRAVRVNSFTVGVGDRRIVRTSAGKSGVVRDSSTRRRT